MYLTRWGHGLFLILFTFVALPVSANPLRDKWEELGKSWSGGEILLKCGGLRLKFTRSFLGQTKLYWLSEDLNWKPLNLLSVLDGGFAYNGLGSNLTNYYLYRYRDYIQNSDEDIKNLKIISYDSSMRDKWHSFIYTVNIFDSNMSKQVDGEVDITLTFETPDPTTGKNTRKYVLPFKEIKDFDSCALF